jgi:hypothetical protein
MRNALPDLLAFGATAVASFVLRWNLPELVWGLWLSSLLVGYALIVWGIFAAAYRHTAAVPATGTGAAVRALGGLGALFMLAFFTVHFGGFHFVHGVFLGAFFPLTAEPGGFDDVAGNAMLALGTGWPLVATSAIAMRDAFVRAGRQFTPQTPYKSVIRMHVLIFVFAGAHVVGLDSRILYIIVLFFYFFPLRSLLELGASERQAGA